MAKSIRESRDIIPAEQNEMMEDQGRAQLLEPLWKRQPDESDAQWRAFLIYRELPPDHRTLLRAAQIFFDNDNLKIVPKAHKKTAYFWDWDTRIESFLKDIQEQSSVRSEEARRKVKENVEIACEKITSEISKVMDAKNIEELKEVRFNIAKLEMLCGKGNIFKTALDSYKTVIGNRLSVNANVKVEALNFE